MFAWNLIPYYDNLHPKIFKFSSLVYFKVSTFELVLILKEEKRDLGQSIRNWLSHLTGSKKLNEVNTSTR